MLSRRLFSAAIIVSVMIFLTWLDFYLGKTEILGRPGLVIAGLMILVSTLAAGELVNMWRTESLELKTSVGAFCALIMSSFAVVPLAVTFPVDCPIGNFGWPMLGFAMAIGTAFLFEMKFSQLDRAAVERLAFYVLGLGYILLLVGFLAAHRLLERDNLLGIFSIVLSLIHI